MMRIVDGFRRSSDLRLRIAFSLGDLERGPDGLFRRPELVPLADLLDAARGSTDPVVLDLLLWRCDARCDRVELARRWVDVDRGNQVAWLSLAALLDQRGQKADARETVMRAARAPSWHAYWPDLQRTIAKAVPDDVPVLARAGATVIAMAQPFGVIPYDAIHMVIDLCRASDAQPELRDRCRRLVATMVRDAQGMSDLAIAPAAATHGHEDPTVVRGYRTTLEAMRWAATEDAVPGLVDDDDVDGAARTLAWMQRRLELGEVGRLRAVLAERGLRDADAAALYVASLTPEQRAYRAASADLARSTAASP